MVWLIANQDNPNDGSVENKYIFLPGGGNRGHAIGQCHLDGMNWPAAYWDKGRNAEMNTLAAR